MNIHVLKIRDEYISDVFTGRKKAELRKMDRGYKVGDWIHFVMPDGTDFLPTNFFEITYIYEGTGEFGLRKGYGILSIKEVRSRQKT